MSIMPINAFMASQSEDLSEYLSLDSSVRISFSRDYTADAYDQACDNDLQAIAAEYFEFLFSRDLPDFDAYFPHYR